MRPSHGLWRFATPPTSGIRLRHQEYAGTGIFTHLEPKRLLRMRSMSHIFNVLEYRDTASIMAAYVPRGLAGDEK